MDPKRQHHDDEGEKNEDDQVSFADLLRQSKQANLERKCALEHEAVRDKKETSRRAFRDETAEEKAMADPFELEMKLDGQFSQGFFHSAKPVEKLPLLAKDDPGHEALLYAVFFSPNEMVSSRAGDQFRVSPVLKLRPQFVSQLFALLCNLRPGLLVRKNVKRGLRLLVMSVLEDCRALVMESLKFACFENSLGCELELSRLLQGYLAAQTSVVNMKQFVHEAYAVVMGEDSGEDLLLFRLGRIGRLFTHQSYTYLSNMVDQFEPQSLVVRLRNDLCSRPVPQAVDYRRWYGLLVLIEFKLRVMEEEERGEVCKALHEFSSTVPVATYSPACLEMDQFLIDIQRSYGSG
ncbi:hypothetical protein BASA81_000002 [Batrachochytrium salamandrivorans]|nr:hypothetical protein BASA81_000002 [Batrachochytrium salamandrivorans]